MLRNSGLASFIAIALTCFFQVTVLAQFNSIDSLRHAFSQETDPQKKALQYYDLAQALMKEKPELGIPLADTLEQLGKKARHPKSIARAAYLRGEALYEQGKFEEAMPHYRQQLNLAQDIDELEMQGQALNRIGGVFQNTGHYDSSIVYLTQSAKIKEQLGNQKDIAAIYSNIGSVFSDMKLPDKAIEWLEKALAIRLSLPDGEKGAIVTYNNISIAYNGKEDFDKAIEYAQKGYDLAIETGNKFHGGVLAGSLGHLWLEKKDVDKSIEMSEKAAALLTETNRKSNLVFPLVNLAEAWWRKGNNAKALEYNDRGYAIMQELKLVEPLEVYYENYANIYESLGDYKQSLVWFKKFMALDDSLFNKEKLNAVAQAEARFENEKKQAQLAKQQLELVRQANLKNRILIGSLVVVIALFGLFQYLRNKQKIRQKEAEIAAEKAALEAQIEHAEAEKLREMDTLKSTFFANISHEFRTPLTLIISPLEQMMSGTFKGDFQKYYRIMHRNGKRLLDLVNQLLVLSKLESGKLKLEASQGDLSRFVSAVVGSFESLAVRQQVDLQIDVPAEPVLCFFDQDKVEKILVNLVSNAFKFTGEGGRVTVAVAIADDTANLTVRDTGIGIPAEQLPHLFERFTKSSLSEVQAGSGIGLALAKELAELHGGSIGVQSEDGKGTTFSVTLAVGRDFFKNDEIVMAPDSADFENLSKRSPVPPLPQPTRVNLAGLNKPLLLLAEDNPDVRSYIADTLAADYKIIEAENGKLALEKALEATPDLIISDIMMPEMDGMELCKLLKTNEKTSHIPIVMLTALAEQGDKLKGLETGVDDYLVKPFDARELQVRVGNLIAQRQKLQEHFRRTLTAFAPAPVEAESMDAVFLQKVREAVEANLDDENFSVVELGTKIGMSRSQLHRKLSALTGFSPNEVIRNMRLERAKMLLEKKAGTVSEVAFSCGFSSPAYFAKCFKDYFGVTPGEVA